MGVIWLVLISYVNWLSQVVIILFKDVSISIQLCSNREHLKVFYHGSQFSQCYGCAHCLKALATTGIDLSLIIRI